MEAADHSLDRLPVLLRRCRGKLLDVGSKRKIDRLVADDEPRIALPFSQVDSLSDQLQGLTRDRVHLGVELEAEHSLTGIKNTGRRIRCQRFTPPANIIKQDHSGPLSYCFNSRAGRQENRPAALSSFSHC